MIENSKTAREEVYKAMEIESHSGQYLPVDIFETMSSEGKHNYLGKYNPDEFWRLYGKLYYNLFRSPENTDDKEVTPSNRMDLNVQAVVGRLLAFKPKTVLEVGCGFGRCLPYVEANCSTIERLVGLEFSPTMFEKAKEYVGAYKDNKNITLIHGDARDLKFEDNEFDIVYTHVCLTHIPPEFIPQVTSNISRVAKTAIIHIERFNYTHEHPNPHRWSHDLASRYLQLGWRIHEYDNLVKNPDHFTKALTLTKD